MKPKDLGGTSGDEQAVEVDLVEAVTGWKWFRAWWKKFKETH